MFYVPWSINEPFEIVAKGNATAEARAKYLQACLQVQLDKNATLELELKTLRLRRDLEDARVAEQVKVLMDVTEATKRREKEWLKSLKPTSATESPNSSRLSKILGSSRSSKWLFVAVLISLASAGVALWGLN